MNTLTKLDLLDLAYLSLPDSNQIEVIYNDYVLIKWKGYMFNIVGIDKVYQVVGFSYFENTPMALLIGQLIKNSYMNKITSLN